MPSFTAKLPKTNSSQFAGSLQSQFGTSAATPASSAAVPDTSLKALFGQPIPAATPAPPASILQAPTAESVFGPSPWMTAPTCLGPNGVNIQYNPIFFATASTAQKVAQMVGGTVVQSNQFTPNGGPFQQQQANWMVQLPNGKLINPGLVASFYTHGYPQSYIDGMIADAVNNS
jgi:hypothetical protein